MSGAQRTSSPIWDLAFTHSEIVLLRVAVAPFFKNCLCRLFSETHPSQFCRCLFHKWPKEEQYQIFDVKALLTSRNKCSLLGIQPIHPPVHPLVRHKCRKSLLIRHKINFYFHHDVTIKTKPMWTFDDKFIYRYECFVFEGSRRILLQVLCKSPDSCHSNWSLQSPGWEHCQGVYSESGQMGSLQILTLGCKYYYVTFYDKGKKNLTAKSYLVYKLFTDVSVRHFEESSWDRSWAFQLVRLSPVPFLKLFLSREVDPYLQPPSQGFLGNEVSLLARVLSLEYFF